MSFKPSNSKVDLFNEALALLPADPVADPEEDSLEADNCRRFYNGVVARLLERHHFNLATKRIVLAEIGNDREGEWGYAYAKPDDMAYPVAIFNTGGASWSGWTLENSIYSLFGQPMMMQVGGTLYARIDAATLEYTSFDITEADFTARFTELVVLNLAAKICHPVIKDDRKAQGLLAQAEFETQRTIASDLNRNRPTYGNRPSESELVRGAGIDQTFLGTGYPLDPVANPANTGT